MAFSGLRRLALLIILLLVFASPAWPQTLGDQLLKILSLITPVLGPLIGSGYTETFYLRASGDGSAPETIAGAFDAADFNTAGNWDTDDQDDGKIGPNDRVIVLDDDGALATALTIQQPGLAGKPITIVGEANGSATISQAAATGISIASKDYITIDGITITSWLSRGIHATNSNSVLVKNCTISGGNNSSPDHGIQIQWTAGGMLTGIRIENNSIGTIATSEQLAVGFSGIIVQGAAGAVIANNSVNTTNTAGIRLLGGPGTINTDCVIESNDVYGCKGGIFVGYSDASIVRYNKIHDGSGLGIGVAYTNDGIQISYNLIYTLDQTSSTWNGIDVTQNSDNGLVYNNTIYKVHGNSFVIDDAGGSSTGWVVRNNIFDASQNGSHSGVYPLPWRDNGADYDTVSDFNLLVPEATTRLNECGGPDAPAVFYDEGGTDFNDLACRRSEDSQELHSLDSDPLFTNAAGGDFTLQAGSPAINAGVDVSLTQDIVGTTIILPPDIGAYESSVPPGTTTTAP